MLARDAQGGGQAWRHAGHERSQSDRQARELAGLYESLSCEGCHRDALDVVPGRPGLVLNVGAGSERDASWFARRGWDVVAVEPAECMRREGQQRHPRAPIRWLAAQEV